MNASRQSGTAPNVTFERERGVQALSVTRDVAHAVIEIPDGAGRIDRIALTFRVLADANVPIFLVKLHRSAVTLALAGEDLPVAVAALGTHSLNAKTRRDLALVSVHAATMRDMTGVMVEIADALYTAAARIVETGDSHNSVQCLIEADRLSDAIEYLCRAFSIDRSCVSESSIHEEDRG